MRYLLLILAVSVLAGCATAATTTEPRVFYDRKYNAYYPVRPDHAATPDRAAFHDRKHNLHFPVRGSARDGGSAAGR